MAPSGHPKIVNSTMYLSNETFPVRPIPLGGPPGLEQLDAGAAISITRKQPINRVFASSRSSELKSLQTSLLEFTQQDTLSVRPAQSRTPDASGNSCVTSQGLPASRDAANAFVSALELAGADHSTASNSGIASLLTGRRSHTEEISERVSRAEVPTAHCDAGAGLPSPFIQDRRITINSKSALAHGGNVGHAYASLLNAIRQPLKDREAHRSDTMGVATPDSRRNACVSSSGSGQLPHFGIQGRHPVSFSSLHQAGLHDTPEKGGPGHFKNLDAVSAVTSVSDVVQEVSAVSRLLKEKLELCAMQDSRASHGHTGKIVAEGRPFPIQAATGLQPSSAGAATVRTAENFSANSWKETSAGLLNNPRVSVGVPQLLENSGLTADAHKLLPRLSQSPSDSHTLSSLKIPSAREYWTNEVSDREENACPAELSCSELRRDSMSTVFKGGLHARKLTCLNVEFLADPLGGPREKWGRRVHHTYPGTLVTREGRRDSVVVKEIPLPPCRVGDPVWEVEQHIHRMLREWKDKQGTRLIAVKGVDICGEDSGSCFESPHSDCGPGCSGPGVAMAQESFTNSAALLPDAFPNARSSMVKNALKLPDTVYRTKGTALGRRVLYVVFEAAAGPFDDHISLQQLKNQACGPAFLPPLGILDLVSHLLHSLLVIHTMANNTGSHLRIQPDNLLLLPSFEVKLADCLGKMELLLLLAALKNGSIGDVAKAQLTLKLFLEDYNRLVWVDPRVIIKLRQLQQSINAVMTKASLGRAPPCNAAGASKETSSAYDNACSSSSSKAHQGGSPNCEKNILRDMAMEVEAFVGVQRSFHCPEMLGDSASEGNGMDTPHLQELVKDVRRIATEHDLDVASQQRADCWSMGACIFYVISGGQHPYGLLSNPEQILENMVADKPCNLEQFECSPLLKDLLYLLLRYEPDSGCLVHLAACHPLFWTYEDLLLFLRAFRALVDSPANPNTWLTPHDEKLPFRTELGTQSSGCEQLASDNTPHLTKKTAQKPLQQLASSPAPKSILSEMKTDPILRGAAQRRFPVLKDFVELGSLEHEGSSPSELEVMRLLAAVAEDTTLQSSVRRSWLLSFLKKHPALLLRSVRAVLATVFSSGRFQPSIPSSMTLFHNDHLSPHNVTGQAATRVFSRGEGAQATLLASRIAPSGASAIDSVTDYTSLTQPGAFASFEDGACHLTSVVEGKQTIPQPQFSSAGKMLAPCSQGQATGSFGARPTKSLSVLFSTPRADDLSGPSTPWEFSDFAGALRRSPQTFQELLAQHQHPLLGMSVAPTKQTGVSRPLSPQDQATLLKALQSRRYPLRVLLKLRPHGKSQLSHKEVSDALRFSCTVAPAARAPPRQVPWNPHDRKKRQPAILSAPPGAVVSARKEPSLQEPSLTVSHAELESVSGPRQSRQSQSGREDAVVGEAVSVTAPHLPDSHRATDTSFSVTLSEGGRAKDSLLGGVSLEETKLSVEHSVKDLKDLPVSSESSPRPPHTTPGGSGENHAPTGAQGVAVSLPPSVTTSMLLSDTGRLPQSLAGQRTSPGLLRAPQSVLLSGAVERSVVRTANNLLKVNSGVASSRPQEAQDQSCSGPTVGVSLSDSDREVFDRSAGVKLELRGEHREFGCVKRPSVTQTTLGGSSEPHGRQSDKKYNSPKFLAKTARTVPLVVPERPVECNQKAYVSSLSWSTPALSRKLPGDQGAGYSFTWVGRIDGKASPPARATGTVSSTATASFHGAGSMPPLTPKKPLDQQISLSVGAAHKEVRGPGATAAAISRRAPRRMTSIVPGPLCPAKERAVRETVLQGGHAFLGNEVPWFVRWYGELTEEQFNQWIEEESQKSTGAKGSGDDASGVAAGQACNAGQHCDLEQRKPRTGSQEFVDESGVEPSSISDPQPLQADGKLRPRQGNRRTRRRNNGKKKANESKNDPQQLPRLDSGGAVRQKPSSHSKGNRGTTKTSGKGGAEMSAPSRKTKPGLSSVRIPGPPQSNKDQSDPPQSLMQQQENKAGPKVSSSPKKTTKEQKRPPQPDLALPVVHA